ncbi:hypothetical protein ACHAWU_002175 [Discostella pseudostelligera]|uniref:Sulfotransferase n=1 Tax=Discostella pseudostelligera TaxID=259834 RepID=A0ABD3M7T9_9STRA
MRRIHLTFPLVLVWCTLVPMLLLQQYQKNSVLDTEAQVLVALRQKDRRVRRDLRQQQRQGNGDDPLFPSHSSTLFIYIANTYSSKTSATPLLEWSEVQWKDLIEGWNQETTFTNLLQMSTMILHNDGGDTLPSASTTSTSPQVVEDVMRTKMILHCLPKTASTTLRAACNIHLRKQCLDYPIQQDPYGYRNITEFHHAIKECSNIHHFCIQGGSANMDIINYNDENGDSGNIQQLHSDSREPYHFIHMIPFRNFHEWVESAIKQIYSIDGSCNQVDKILDHCLGYRELYFELYSKSVLSLLASMIFHSNEQQHTSGNASMDKHQLVLYNYKDTESIISQVSDYFHLPPLPRTNLRMKDHTSKSGTCHDSDAMAVKFHNCHGEALMSFNYSSTLENEKKRRRQNSRKMGKILQFMNEFKSQDDAEASGD